jgi:hypothetical protein
MKAKNGLGQGQMTGFYEHSNEPTDSRKADNFLTTQETINFT